MTPLTVKKFKSSISYGTRFSQPKISHTFLGEKKLQVLYKKQKCKNENFEKKKKMRFFLMSQGSFNPKIKFLGQKVCSVAREHTDTHESDYCGHPFRVSGVFPSTYHQGSAQQEENSLSVY